MCKMAHKTDIAQMNHIWKIVDPIKPQNIN